MKDNENVKEVYLVYGINEDKLSMYTMRMLLGEPTYISVFDN